MHGKMRYALKNQRYILVLCILLWN